MRHLGIVMAVLTLSASAARARPVGTFAVERAESPRGRSGPEIVRPTAGKARLLWSRGLYRFEGDRIRFTIQMLVGDTAAAVGCEASVEATPRWTATGYVIDTAVVGTSAFARVAADGSQVDDGCDVTLGPTTVRVDEQRDGTIVLHGTEPSGVSGDVYLVPADPAPRWAERMKEAMRKRGR